MARVEILVWVKHMSETHDFINFFMFLWSFIVLSRDSSLFSVFTTHTVFEISSQFIFHYFIEKVLFPKMERLKQYLKPY